MIDSFPHIFSSFTAIPATIVLTLLCTTYVCLEFVAKWSRDVREPPDVAAGLKIPYMGHVVGFLRGGMRYLSDVGASQTAPIYTLRLPFTSIYVTNGPALIPALQRASKTISFTPFQKVTAARLSCVSERVLRLFDSDDGPDADADAKANANANANAGEGNSSAKGCFPGMGRYVRDIDAATHKALAPGEGMDRMNMETAKGVLECFSGLGEGEVRGLYEWVREIVTVASTRGVYGVGNPYLKRENVDAFWTFDASLPHLLAGFPLTLLAPQAVLATQTLTAAFEKYYTSSLQNQASDLVLARHRVHSDYKLTVNEIARMEWPLAIAVLSNTVPTCFWVICEIYSRPGLLERVREEVEGAVVRGGAGAGLGESDDQTCTLSLTLLKTRCPLLLSTFQETQRMRSQHATIRRVLADTKIPIPNAPTIPTIPSNTSSTPQPPTTYLLRKNNYLQLPSAPLHHDPTLWGPDVSSFKPERFVRTTATTESGVHAAEGGVYGAHAAKGALPAKIPTNAFAPWGFSPHLCPARQFATMEILVVVALCVLRIDLEVVSDEPESSDQKGKAAGNEATGDVDGKEEVKAKAWSKATSALPLDTSKFSTMLPPKGDLRVRFWHRRRRRRRCEEETGKGEGGLMWEEGKWNVDVTAGSGTRFGIAGG